MIQYSKRVGGINRVATVLAELVERIQPSAFDSNLLEHVPVTALQRLGYLLDNILDQKSLGNALYKALQNSKATLFRIPLKASTPINGSASYDR